MPYGGRCEDGRCRCEDALNEWVVLANKQVQASFPGSNRRCTAVEVLMTRLKDHYRASITAPHIKLIHDLSDDLCKVETAIQGTSLALPTYM
jgi:hypothetical protein